MGDSWNCYLWKKKRKTGRTQQREKQWLKIKKKKTQELGGMVREGKEGILLGGDRLEQRMRDLDLNTIDVGRPCGGGKPGERGGQRSDCSLKKEERPAKIENHPVQIGRDTSGGAP